jgi:hypothetical protein
MNIGRIQGWALLISALASTLLRLGLANNIQHGTEILLLVSSALLIFGLPSIQTIQPQTKYWGLIGLFLLSIPAIDMFLAGLILLVVDQPLELNHLLSSVEVFLYTTGIMYLGYIMVGWLTIQARVFPVWVGWFLLAVGIFNEVIWFFVIYGESDLLPYSIIVNLFYIIHTLEIVAICGYGWIILRYKTSLDISEINTLKERGDSKSLIKFLQKENGADWMFRLDAAEALAKIGNEQGVDYLISALQSPNIDISEVAKEILEGLNDHKGNLALQSRTSTSK